MSAKFVEVSAVYETYDETGAAGKCIGIFSDSSVAKSFSKCKGWYGGDAKVVSKVAMEVDGEYYLLESKFPIDLDGKKANYEKMVREQALSRLSDEELRVLGLKRNGK